MALTCTENPDSRKYTDGQSAELTYTVRGTADEAAAIAKLNETSPENFNGLVRQPGTVEPVFVDEANPDRCIWTGTVQYSPYPFEAFPQTGDSSLSFDTSGGSQHITQSLANVHKYAAAGQTAPDFKGAIGVTKDSVEGVDITVPVYTFNETHYLAADVVTDAYKGILFNLTGKTNAAVFRGLQVGECLFLGASGSKRKASGGGGGADWEINFRFAGSPNKTNLTIGPITGIAKKGWEYLWVRYADVEGTASKNLVKQPIAAYIEQVYEEGDYTGLGIT